MTETYTGTGFEIAIIGMSARFPGVGNIHEFWDKLKHGSESITFFSREELAAEGIPREMLDDPNYVKACGVLENKDYFDASFFGYSPREAELMAPQTRLFHECAWSALEDSGYDPFRFGGLIGLYGGANHDYEWEIKTVLSGKVDDFASYTAAYLTNKDFLCTLVSYKLNLVGPSMIVDTACSTSLVAVHTACQAIINGECDMALAGGSAITAHKKRGYLYHEGMILSPDGHCRTFDAGAKGTLAGEGVGIVVLKRLTEAVRDRNNIYAVIKGSAANNDGVRKPGFTAPSVEGQAEVIKAAMQMAGVEPQQMGYVETHGTGTQLGDPVEIEALTLAFNIRKKTFCPIGSVKSNFGHLDVAAGIAGLIKTVLSLKNRLIPPSLNFQQPNPKIDFANSPFYVNDKTIQWKNDKYPLVAGVSSFGIGGTNVHVILEQAPELNESVRKESNAREYQLILLSAKTGTALDQMTVNLSAYLKQNPAICLPDVAYTLQQGRKVFRHRRMLVCPTNNLDHAIQALSAKDPGKIHSSEAPEEHPPMIFMFPGQGAQYVDMGLELYQTEPVFARAMDHCFEILKPLMGYDLKEILYPVYRSNRSYTSNKSNKSHINQTEITQPVIFAIEYALAQLLLEWGIKPYAMIGHSIGEYTAACLSGVFSLEEALKLVALRGKLMQKVPSGAMLSVPAAEKALIPLLNEELDLAAVNSGSICVVSGTHQAIEDFDNQLRDRGIQSRPLHTSHAFHSKMMNPILTEFENKIKENQIQFNPPGIQYISNVTGDWMIPARVADPGYWSAHLRKTVRFSDGAAELLKQEDAIFVEVGPGTVLSTFVRKHPHKKPSHQMINLLRHPNEKVSDIRCLVEKLGQLWLAGAAIDWRNFYSREERYRLPLPTYPFEGVRFWIDEVKQPKPPTSHKIQDPKNWFYIPTWTPSEPGADSNSNSPGAFPSPIKGLVFMDSIGLGSQLLRQWEMNRGNRDIITVVKPGAGFNKVNDREYIINPGQSNDYDALFKELKDTDCIPGIIIYLWTVTGTANNGSPVEEIDQHQQPAFYSLLDIARALGNQAVTANLQLNVITDNMQKVTGDEVLCPAKAMVLGPVKVIPREYPNITCSSIDIVLPEPGSREETNLINQLLGEFALGPENRNRYRVVAYRDNHRLVRTYEPYTYNGPPGTKTGPSRLKEGGVYLVTGGLGGIGYTIARHLAETVRCSLVLVGRSSLPARDEWDQWLASHEENDPVSLKIENLRQLEKLAGQVLFFSADVSDRDRMQGIFKQVKGELGPIDGLLHAAGVADYEGTIQRRSLETTAGVLAPKIKGTAVLDQLVKEENIPLDFFILCSSITTILGSFGEVGYCSANAYLDAFAQYKASQPTNKQSSSRHWTISVNWDAWQEVGMAVEAVKRSKGTKHEGEYRDALNLGILPWEGAEVMANIAAFPALLPQVVVSTTNLQNRLQPPQQAPAAETAPASTALTPAGEAGTAVTLYQRPGLSTAYTAPSDDTGRILARVWQEHLGIEKIGIYDNFFELGADSLDLMKINTRLKEVFEKDIPIVSFYTYPTIEALTGYLEGESYEIQFSREELRRLRSSFSPDEQGEVKKGKSREVAVIGMAGRFPGAKNLAEYWENLKNGVEAIFFFGDEELEEEGFPAKMLKEPNYVRAKAYIEGIEYYDVSFFGYKPREAEAMDPQIRVFQECVWEALETAGYEPSSNQTIGLYAGGSDSGMWMKRVVSLGALYSELLLSNKDVLCTQTSYKLDLKGPSFSLQTACSTSLVAVHLACRGVVDHECDMALAGGVSITLPKKSGYLYQEGMIRSPEGHVRAFDAKANGTVFGNGAGVVLLKRLDKAEADGDTIYAVIKGTAINNDGERKVGFTAPSTKGQAEVIMAALHVADVEPESITYVETHGTGTSVGDPIEIEALKLAFSTDKKQFCGLGSVKTNIGHLDAAAGIASFIKAVLILKHRIIPPSLHFETPNPEVDLDNSPFYVINRLTPWESNTYPKRAGVSSFGVGGTNAHVVLEEWPEDTEAGTQEKAAREYQLILLSAKTLPALDKMTTNLAEYLKKNPRINLADVAYTLQVGRKTLEYGKSLVCHDVNDAIEALSSPASGMVHRLLKKDRNKAMVFMFPGQGAQYVNMGLGLYQTEPVFREQMDRCFKIFKTLDDYDIKEILYPDEALADRGATAQPAASSHKINQTEITQPVIFIFEYALARLLMHWGIKPDAMIGHSIGEFTAACLAGVLSLEDALKLVAIRGKLMQQMPPGAMLSVQLPEEQLKPLMEEEISLAAVNGLSFCVVSGTHETVDAFEKKLKEMGHKTTRLHTSHAFHSGMMDPVVEDFKEKARQVRWDKPKIPYISNVTGQWLTDEQAASPGYWAAHLRQTVRFSDGITGLLKQEKTIFLEIGPGRVLTTLARKQAQNPNPSSDPKNQWMINLIKHPQEETPDESYLLNRVGQLWLYGGSIDWKAYYGEEKRYRIPLSTYPFERQRFWSVVENTKDIEDQKETTSPLERKPVEQWFYIPSWKRSLTTSIPNAGTSENGNKTNNSWLVFTDSLGLGTQLCQRLQKQAGEVITVSMGQTFEKLGPGTYTLNPQKNEDYEHLFNELAALNQLPTSILHLWNVTGENGKEPLEERVDNRLETGFYSMLSIARAVGKAGFETGLRWWMITDGMQEVVGGDVQCPLKAAILGPTRVINREYANIDCRT
ncbi:SDR family NAD(P)-dependent oxidoreductase [Acidobacteriota bacterium]